ncbi:AraC family transcriptional regulator [Hoeflea ulvae]|uniref:AraC family transcriptional regulator n=1 Tax=Hoeflea ulvae TaxID=2983764 RepID=A0ABT3YFG4_9HYPH|nr:AraC family transcriptional regulator [Hoeflea ulvae]MCY0094643.1 AraC family transcriptional regulator [Hoeflea ulvae]
MDVLTEIFSTLRLQAGLYFSTAIRGDFAIGLAAERRRIRFHLVLEGKCVVTVPDQDQISLAQGDLVLIPDGAPQILSSGENVAAPVDLDDLIARVPPVDGVLHHGDVGPLCRILCGFLRFDEAIDHPVLDSLPPMIPLRQSCDAAPSGVAASLALLHAETSEPGAGQASILHRIVEILLMQIVRSSLPDHAAHPNGFARALADPRLSRALSAMHSGFETAWDIEMLAARAGMSRSRFAESFSATVGMTPFAYLTRWRMIKARELLQQPGLDMAEIAERCGYRSVPAFGRRFAAMFAVGPGEWRRQAQSYSQNAPGMPPNSKP